MDLSVFNKYREYQSETEKQFTPALRTDNHEDPDIHLIGESVPSASVVSTIGDTATVGVSGVPAKEDHAHGYTPYSLPLSNSTPTPSSTSTGTPGTSTSVARADHRHQYTQYSLPDPLTRSRFGITSNGSSLSPAVYFTNNPYLGFYQVAGGIQFTSGGVGTLFIGSPISTTLDIGTYGSIYSRASSGRFIGFTGGGIYMAFNTLYQAQAITSTSGDCNFYSPSGYHRFNNWIKYVSPPGISSGYLDVIIQTGSNIISFFTSKRELKENIQDFSKSGPIIDSLQPVTFIEKAKGEETEEATKWREACWTYGFVAEDVAEVSSPLATWQFNDEEELLPVGWDKNSMLAVVVAELKDLRARVSELEDKLHGKALLDAK